MSVLTAIEDAIKGMRLASKTEDEASALKSMNKLDDGYDYTDASYDSSISEIDYSGGDPEQLAEFQRQEKKVAAAEPQKTEHLDEWSEGARSDLVDKFELHSAETNLDDIGADLYNDAFDQIVNTTGIPEEAIGLGGRLTVGNLIQTIRKRKGLNPTAKGVLTPDRENPAIHAQINRYIQGEHYTAGVMETIQHEWMHGLDNYFYVMFADSGRTIKNLKGEKMAKAGDTGDQMVFKDERGTGQQIAVTLHAIDTKDFNKLGYATQMAKLTGMRPELFEKWNALREAVTKEGTAFSDASKAADRVVGQTYYSDHTEMMARAFESYMRWKTERRLLQGPYINKQHELEKIVPLFDDFFKEMKFGKAKNRQGLRATHIYGIGATTAAGVMTASPDNAEAGTIGIGNALGAIKQRQEALDAITSEGDGQAPPAQEPQDQEPTFESLTPEQKSEYALSDFDSVKEYLDSKK